MSTGKEVAAYNRENQRREQLQAQQLHELRSYAVDPSTRRPLARWVNMFCSMLRQGINMKEVYDEAETEDNPYFMSPMYTVVDNNGLLPQIEEDE